MPAETNTPNKALALQEAFDGLLKRLKTDEAVIDDLRSLQLNNLSNPECPQYTERAMVIAQEMGYVYARAVCHVMRFYHIYSADVDAAMHENECARDLLLHVPNYRRKPSYLSMLNNAVLGYTLKHDYVKAYRNAIEALSICDPQKNIVAYTALLNNTSAILTDVGLNRRALMQMEYSMACLDLQSEYSAATTRFRYAVALVRADRLDEAQEQCRWMIEHQSHLFPWQVYPVLIRIAYRQENDAEMDRLCEELLSHHPFEDENSAVFDRRNASYALALADIRHRRFEAAEEKLLSVLAEGGSGMLTQSDLLRDTIHLYEEWGKPEKVPHYLAELNAFQENALTVADELLEYASGYGGMNMRRATKALFKRLRSATELGQLVCDCLSYPAVRDCLIKHLGDVCPFDSLELALADRDGHYIAISQLESKEAQHWDDFAIVRSCVEHGELINLPDIEGQSASLPPFADGASPTGGSVLFAPVRYQTQTMGVIALHHHEAVFYSQDYAEALRMLCGSLGVALHVIAQYQSVVISSLTDPLTGALNRTGLHERERAVRSREAQCYGLLYLDLDDFKSINDTYGHDAGDRLLVETVAVLKDWARSRVVARYGGDEFIVIISVRMKQELKEATDELLALFAEKMRMPDGSTLKVSIGVSMLLPEQSMDAIIVQADQALYKAKRHGKNRAHIAR